MPTICHVSMDREEEEWAVMVRQPWPVKTANTLASKTVHFQQNELDPISNIQTHTKIPIILTDAI